MEVRKIVAVIAHSAHDAMVARCARFVVPFAEARDLPFDRAIPDLGRCETGAPTLGIDRQGFQRYSRASARRTLRTGLANASSFVRAYATWGAHGGVCGRARRTQLQRDIEFNLSETTTRNRYRKLRG